MPTYAEVLAEAMLLSTEERQQLIDGLLETLAEYAGCARSTDSTAESERPIATANPSGETKATIRKTQDLD